MSDKQPTDPTEAAAASQPVDEAAASDTVPEATTSDNSAWRRLIRMGRPRLTKANLFATGLALALGFAIATQVHQTTVQGLSTLRSEDLVRILDNVQQDNSRLSEELVELQANRDKLLSGAASSQEAKAAAQDRLDTLGVLAGTVPATGRGITITITDPERGVTAPLLLDTIEELRDAGAEAMSINQVRIVASTYFTDEADGAVSADGSALTAPYVLKVIGDPGTLASAMDIPGGVSENVRFAKAQIAISQEQTVSVTALHTTQTPRYARPVDQPTTATP